MHAVRVFQVVYKSPRSTLNDFHRAKVIDKDDYRVRKTLESWHTAMTNEADNNFKPLSGQ